MPLTPEERALLQEVLERFRTEPEASLPRIHEFRLAHESEGAAIDKLSADGYLVEIGDRYLLTVEGLLACGSPEAKSEVEAFNRLLPTLKDAYRTAPEKMWAVAEIAALAGQPAANVARTLTFAPELSISAGFRRKNGLITGMRLAESVLEVEPIDWPDEQPGADADHQPHSLRIESLEISGYRPFSGFRASLGELTVLIGANASGKSSLFDLLRFVSFAASNPLPPEIDPRSGGRTLFHAGGPDQISLALVVDHGEQKPLRYEVEIHGPAGAPKVVREWLATTEPTAPGAKEPFSFLDFRGGNGVVRDRGTLKRHRWAVQPNELALRRALDPTLVTISKFQNFLSSWRFYSGFDVSGSGAIRKPVPTEPSPTLAENGANLSAVLFWLMTEHVDVWEELETHLQSAIPGFQSLNVKAVGGPGTVIATWREQGVKGSLTLADLSDGTLRLLCWATLCLSPAIPPLICIDEPELGLHPRVLPILAGLLRFASARSQVLVATHSPYLLSQFKLDEIAVMRKEEGRAVFVRPRDSKGLRREVEELGGEALSQLHISDELEVRS